MSPRNLALAALVAATVFIAMPKAHAGYAQVAAPAGWSAGTGATYGTLPARFGAAAANSGSMWSASTVINVGGRAVTMPAAGSFAANAGRFAARGLAFNPLAIGVAGAAWLAQECISYTGGKFILTCGQDPQPEPNDGYIYSVYGVGGSFKSAAAAAAAAMEFYAAGNPGNTYAIVGGFTPYADGSGGTMPYTETSKSDGHVGNGNLGISRKPAPCPAGWSSTPAGCVQDPDRQPKVLTPEEVVEKMAPHPVPPPLFPEIPDVPLPIGPPSINPTPAPDLSPQPLRVPVGDPVKVPNSNPQRWEQPIITITPSPAPDSPWRVNLTPEKVISNSPEPIRQPWTGPLPAPAPGSEPAPDRTVESDPSRGDPELAPTDTELPELPKLYEPKYKNGLEGVWNEQKEKIKSAPLSNLIENLMPKVSGGGSCPTWNVQLEFSSWANYGSKNVAPPCEVWDWGRMIILVSALILARALIFGG